MARVSALHGEAATRGDPTACIEVAGLYKRGVSGQIAKDKELAKRWYLKALACKEKEDGDGEEPDDDEEAQPGQRVAGRERRRRGAVV